MNVSKNQSPNSAIEMWIKSPVLNVVYSLTSFITLAAIALFVVNYTSVPDHFAPGTVVITKVAKGEVFLKLFCTMSEVFGFGVGLLTLLHAFCVKEMRVPSRGPNQIVIERAPRLICAISMIVVAAIISYFVRTLLAGNADVKLMSQIHPCKMQSGVISHLQDSNSVRLHSAV